VDKLRLRPSSPGYLYTGIPALVKDRTPVVQPTAEHYTDVSQVILTTKHTYTEGSKKMYSLFDSQYLWNKMTCSYNSCAERERVIVCVRSDHHQRLNRVDAAELLSEYGCQCVRCDGCIQRVSTLGTFTNLSHHFSYNATISPLPRPLSQSSTLFHTYTQLYVSYFSAFMLYFQHSIHPASIIQLGIFLCKHISGSGLPLSDSFIPFVSK
jgi:hypothetical protein